MWFFSFFCCSEIQCTHAQQSIFYYLSTLEVPCIRNTRLLASFPGYQTLLQATKETPLQVAKERVGTGNNKVFFTTFLSETCLVSEIPPLQAAKERVGTGTCYFKRVHTAAFKSLSLEQSHSYSSHTKAPLQ